MDIDNVKHLLDGSVETRDVPIEHMDYEYISKSSNIKELEKILKALRSGKDGLYPDLIRHCEERIGELDPESKVLRKDKGPATKFDVGKEEWQQCKSDIKSFIDETQSSDQSVKQEEDVVDEKENLPIRGTVTIDTSGQKTTTSSESDSKPSDGRIRSRDYKSWENYDVDKELERVDETDETKNARLLAQELNSSRSAGIQDKLKTEGYTAKELEMLANREKDKGNEAFRAGDYSEAIVYYSRSLSVIPSAPAYNNRALAKIRLEQFKSAVGDCNMVLEIESGNLKAMLRRGTARKSLQRYEESCKDLEYVLSVEPGNKQAKDLLKDVRKKMKTESKPSSTHKNGLSNGTAKGGKRMVIEEVEGSSDSTDSGEDSVDGNISSRRKNPVGKEKDSQGFKSESNDSNISSGGGTVKVNSKPVPTAGETVSNGPPLSNHTQMTSPKVETEAVQSSIKEKPLVEEIPAKPLPEKVVKLKDEGTMLYKAGQYGNAKDKYSTALGILEKDKSSYQSAIGSLYSNRAACHLKLGDCQGCITDCDLVLEISPYNVKVYLRRGNAYETIERFNDAYLDFYQVMTLDPYNNTAQVGASRVQKVLYENIGPDWRQRLPARTLLTNPRAQQMQSVSTLENGPTELTPTVPDGIDLAASTVAPNLEKYTPEVKVTREETEATEEEMNVTEEETDVTGEEKTPGKTLSKEGQFQKLKSDGNNLVKKGKYEDAIKCYTSCTEIDSTQPVSFTNRALCYLKLNQNKEAEVDCTTALDLDSKNVKGYYRRALARKGLENYFDSIKDLTALLKLEPSNGSAKKELEMVKDFWRKELNEKHQNQPSTTGSSKPGNGKKNILIEEADSDSEEEKESVQDDKKSNTPVGKSSGKKNSPSNSREKESKEDKHSKHQNNRTDSKSSDKHKNSRSKSKKDDKEARNSKAAQSTHSPKLNKVTAYEFIQAWMSLKSTKNSLPYAELLRQVPPEQLTTVLSNKLDAPMLTKILKAVEEHLVKSDPERSYKLLTNLCRAQRFQTVLLFMTNEEKQGIDKCLESLSANENQFCSKEDIAKLRKSFGLIC